MLRTEFSHYPGAKRWVCFATYMDPAIRATGFAVYTVWHKKYFLLLTKKTGILAGKVNLCVWFAGKDASVPSEEVLYPLWVYVIFQLF
jgi:hypothetical protein